MIEDLRLTRRGFMAATAAVAAGHLIGCGGAGTDGEPLQDFEVTKAFMLSGRGRRVSNAAKKHNHNKVFVSRAAAQAGRAHPGDTSGVVSIDVKPETWLTWFAPGVVVAPDELRGARPLVLALPASQVRAVADLRNV